MQLRGIEQHVVALNLSGEFSDRCYTLREHLASARPVDTAGSLNKIMR